MGNPAGMRKKQKIKRRKKEEKRLMEKDEAAVKAETSNTTPAK